MSDLAGVRRRYADELKKLNQARSSTLVLSCSTDQRGALPIGSLERSLDLGWEAVEPGGAPSRISYHGAFDSRLKWTDGWIAGSGSRLVTTSAVVLG